MIPILALLLTAAPGAAVTGVRVLPVENQTQVVIDVDGPVGVEDFTLADPERLVVDLSGARQALPSSAFSGIDRGGVLGLNATQYRPDVVRVVFDLAAPVHYTVEHTQHGIAITFPNGAGAFQAWGTAPAGAAPSTPPSAGADSLASPSAAPPGPPMGDEGHAAPPSDATTPRRPAAAGPAPAAAGPAPTAVKAAPVEPRITVSFESAPILDVIQTFASFANRSIVAGKDVQGTITADIHGQPWDQALEAILEAQGYTVLERESGILQVVKLEELRNREKNEDLLTRAYRIRYTAVDSIAQAIKSQLSGRGRLTENPATNTLIVTDVPSILDQISPLIQQLDVRTPQVTIAAKIVFVDRTALNELGVVYDLKDSRGNQINQLTPGYIDSNGNGSYQPSEQTNQDVVLLGGNSVAALANANDRVASPSLRIVTSLLLGRHTLVSFLEALSSLQLSDIQAAPVVTVLDNRQANIQVGEETPVRIIDAGASSGGGTAFPRATVQFKKTGVILNVTPHVTGDQVLLELHAERSNLAAAPSDLGITFQTQQSDTQVLVDDGETAVIGGLTIIEKTQSRTGIPLLMNLPLIGRLFSHTATGESKKDLLIMVTPHIVRDGA
jgi:type IV pilus assembly protein PilQ